ncbi:hypothetical protein Gasu2_29690 [Galdieria sulphuraria]|nr:hypothetical protein Gasu2_29690 [Galdieria sulphuraria]
MYKYINYLRQGGSSLKRFKAIVVMLLLLLAHIFQDSPFFFTLPRGDERFLFFHYFYVYILFFSLGDEIDPIYLKEQDLYLFG